MTTERGKHYVVFASVGGTPRRLPNSLGNTYQRNRPTFNIGNPPIVDFDRLPTTEKLRRGLAQRLTQQTNR